ncbi:MAG: bifunctional phosphoserine phosphatase/homoserine phosphotransferase ThrH [Spirochaetes bacterium]|nr:bifunctional phosphoserine phosphatase/homoserine phosphotransferase ThrH [Spirochaetota bacterium]
MTVACLDLEGVLLPEIWIGVSKKTGIEKLSLTTRDISDYDELMRLRLRILRENNIKMKDIKDVIATLSPLEGAYDFLKRLQKAFQVIILSDTYYEFAMPLIEKLGSPTLFCHKLEIDDEGFISDYKIRLRDSKKESVIKLKELNFKVIASGDSYNDTSMLGAADAGILFCPPDNVIREFPQFPVCLNYDDLYDAFIKADAQAS